MGRGLSDLQQQILGLAFNRYTERGADGQPRGRPPHPADVYPVDVLCFVYGWQPAKGRLYWGWAQHFHPEDIGPVRYRSDRAVVCRAFRRLEQRGLLDRPAGHMAGRNLTASGVALVQEWVSANNDEYSIIVSP
jgi:hypothetical protein